MLSRNQGQGAAWSGACLAAVMWIMGGAGGAQAELRFTPSLAVSERFEDNVRFSSTNKEADFATVVSPTVAFTARGREVDVSGSWGSQITRFMKATNSNLNRVNSLGGAVLDAGTVTGRVVRGLGLKVTENYAYTQELPEFTQFGQTQEQASGGIQTGRTSTFINTFGITAPYVLTERAQMTGSYTNSIRRFSGGSILVSSTSHALVGGGSYAVTPQTALLSNYSYSRFSFGGGGSVDTHAVDAGFRRQFLADLLVDATVGGTYLPSLDRLTPNFNAGLTKKFSATNVGARFTRSVFNSGGLAAAVSTREVLTGSVTHTLTRALTATISGNYATTKSVGLRTVDIASYSLVPAVSYSLTRWATLTASYTYFHQKSEGFTVSLTGSEFARNTATVGVTVTWP
nr:outer membrane beta-barrel protein [Nitrospirota bacterium]